MWEIVFIYALSQIFFRQSSARGGPKPASNPMRWISRPLQLAYGQPAWVVELFLHFVATKFYEIFRGGGEGVGLKSPPEYSHRWCVTWYLWHQKGFFCCCSQGCRSCWLGPMSNWDLHFFSTGWCLVRAFLHQIGESWPDAIKWIGLWFTVSGFEESYLNNFVDVVFSQYSCPLI